MITGMERLVAAINGGVSDRIPVFCNLIDQGAKELGMPLKEYYADGAHVAEAQLRMRERYGHDNVWSLFYVGKEAELLGCRKIRYAEDGPPNVEDYVIKVYDDIAVLRIPTDLNAHPAFREELKCLQILKREVGGKYPICAYVTSTMTLPALLMGMDKWLELLLCGPPDLRDALLTKCHEFFVKEMTAYRDAGADVLVYSNPFGSTDTVSMNYFHDHSLPWIERDIKAVGTAGIVYYCGTSRFNRVIDSVLKRTGIGVYYLSPLDDLVEGKKIIAGRGLTCGVINDMKLIDWTREEIRAEVRRLIEAGMPGGKFLFGTGVMPYQIPEENIRTMLEAAYEYGSYEKQGS
ncbi:methylcobamide:CoM methyltransferase MtaA [Geobacter sp. OR-1]|uniref:uroporphyrinogen decarboxylase family protein n=1 Tax=Geobacter sp. OR-1 TaxID=1266765 RepID=UPI0005429F2F|nr:uroporphyrinogen decarboxylase family protein [Geobacter sp. OR-1]GAM10797.1 methylcobamide:CoM methyltransferase MtaA [Geobacter sp. OR-1]